jgi:hypothetical protein
MDPIRARITPPDDLSPGETRLFNTIVSQTPPNHFRQTDGPLVAAYVEAILLSRQSFKEHDWGLWERATKLRQRSQRNFACVHTADPIRKP